MIVFDPVWVVFDPVWVVFDPVWVVFGSFCLNMFSVSVKVLHSVKTISFAQCKILKTFVFLTPCEILTLRKNICKKNQEKQTKTINALV